MRFLPKLNLKGLVCKYKSALQASSKESRTIESQQNYLEKGNIEKGDSGEVIAYKYLRRNGYKIVARKYRRRSGEIDLIGWDKNILVFIEVKFRSDLEHGRPEEAVNLHKQRQICRVAKEYRNRYKLHGINYRFDIVSVQGSKDPCLQTIKDAFRDGPWRS